MKKIILIIFVSLLFIGCGNKEEVKNEEIEQNNSVVDQKLDLLEGYPEEVLPLYKPDNLETMKFTRREDYNYTIGKDLYALSYNSKGTVEEITNYYQSLVTDENYDDVVFIMINNHKVNLNVQKFDEDSDLVYVGLTLGSIESEYVDKNPYFADYPENLVEVYSKTRLQEETYEENHLQNLKYYRTIYETNLEMNEYLKHYEDLYKDKDSYLRTEEEKKTILTWKDQGFEIRVSYEYSGLYKYVNITATKPLK